MPHLPQTTAPDGLVSVLQPAPVDAFDPASAERARTRSLVHHRLDPAAPRRPRILSGAEVRAMREANEPLLRVALPSMDCLHGLLQDTGHCILLTDPTGATLDVRGPAAAHDECRHGGLAPGACWSESNEGACGVGSALEEAQPVLIHREEHFLLCNAPISCSAAPVFGPGHRIAGVLNATALHAPSDRASQWLTLRLVMREADRMSAALFSAHWSHTWLLHITLDSTPWHPQSGPLLALDADDRVLDIHGPGLRLWLARHFPRAQYLSDWLDTRLDTLLQAHRHAPGQSVAVYCPAAGATVYVRLQPPQAAPSPSTSPTSSPSPVLPVRPAARSTLPGSFQSLTLADPGLVSQVHRLVRLLDGGVPILLQGETGTGKEVFAQAIHGASQRHAKPFIALNCAAIPESLIESELFGHQPGAFTGAAARGSPGRIRQAHGGTLFLDEIGDMPLPLQTRLLRVLAEGEITALGALRPEPVDLQVVCATHRHLPALVQSGAFRADLFYRLNAATVTLPPLRQRADLNTLIDDLLQAECQRADRPRILHALAREALLQHTWPGNIRELRHALRVAVLVSDGPCVLASDLPALTDTALADAALTDAAPSSTRTALLSPELPTPPDSPATESDGQRIRHALLATGGNASAAAQYCGWSRSTFYRRLRALGIPVRPQTPRTRLPAHPSEPPA